MLVLLTGTVSRSPGGSDPPLGREQPQHCRVKLERTCAEEEGRQGCTSRKLQGMHLPSARGTQIWILFVYYTERIADFGHHQKKGKPQ